MRRLKLGVLPDDRPVRISITIPADLKCALEAYAEAYAQESGRACEMKKLIPHILAAFLKSDRTFAKLKATPTKPPGNAAGPG